MTPNEFVQKWLPDYNEKWEETQKRWGGTVSVKDFVEFYFQQAYENAMKAQREICKNALFAWDFGDEVENEILNAPTP